MTTKSKIASVPLTGVTIAYYFTLAAIFLASTFPTYRVWGLNWWAYFPLWVRLGLLAVGLVTPLVIDRVINRLLSDRDDISARTYRWLIGGFAVVMIALFYLLRARTHFLGDGYQLLSTLESENPFIRPRNFGGMLIQHVIFKLLNGEAEAGALLAYQIVSIAAGVCFIGITIWAASRLISKHMERLLFLLLACTGGYALMFFGYVENYSFFVVSVAAFSLVSLLAVEGKISRWWIIPCLAVASIFHIFGVVLTLPALYLLLYETALWNKLSKWPARYKILLSVLVLVIVGAVFAYSYMTSWFFRLSLLPLWPNMFTVEGYTLFSTAHLVDFLNLVALLFPGLLVIAVALFQGRRLTGALWHPIVPIALIAFSCAGTAFIFDPKLGMPRDWDLFSFAGVPLILELAYFLLNLPGRLLALRTLLLVVVLNALVFAPRAVALAMPEFTLGHMQSYADLDTEKSGSARYLLAKYFRQIGDEVRARAVDSTWRTLDPDQYFVSGTANGQIPMDSLHLAQALRRVVADNPSNWTAWGNLGVLMSRRQQFDSAVYYLRISDALNPYNPATNLNLGYCYYHLESFELSESYILNSIKLDTTSTLTSTLMLLGDVYRDSHQEKKYVELFSRIARRPDAPPKYVVGWIELLLRDGKYAEAAEEVHRTIGIQIDSAYLRSILERYPQLRDIITQ